MRKLFFLFLFSTSSFSQDSKEHKFDILFSYGVAYIDYSNYSSTSLLNFDLPQFGSFLELNLDYKLPKSRFIGLGLSRQLHSKNIYDGVLINSTNTGLLLENYKNTHIKDFIDIHFKTVFKNNIHFTIGSFYFIENLNTNTISSDDTNIFFIISNEKNRSDNFGFFGSLEYFFSLRSYVELGVKSKLYYSLNGIETISLLPTLRVKI